MKSSKPIRILVVDDHFMVRMGLSASLNVEPDMEVVAEAGSGDAALEAYRTHRPSMVLMDLRLPGMSGTDCTAAMIQEFPEASILMLSTHSGEEEIYRAMQAGAYGYLLKSAPRDELLVAIRAVAEKKRYLPPELGARLVKEYKIQSLTSCSTCHR